VRKLLGRLIVTLDDAGHILDCKTGCGHSVRLCLAADVVYGWGPDAEDWKRSAGRLHRLLYRVLW
jgi:hypothetical protein